MVVIQSATYGDEFSRTDVLQPLQTKIKEEGGVNVTVNSSLIPLLNKTLGAGTSLTPAEQAEIKEAAAQVCGAADQICIEVKTQEIASAKLKEKEASTVNAANMIKGNRLEVDYTDEKGVRRRAVIPEGQKFQVGEKAGLPVASFDYEAALNKYKSKGLSFWKIFGTAILVFLYVSSVVITWMTYSKFGSKLIAAGWTAVAVFIPYSGFWISFFGPFLYSYLKTDKTVGEIATGEIPLTKK